MYRRVLLSGLLAWVLLLLASASLFAAEDAMAEVNAARARHGLPPFIEDPNLTAGAKQVADHRANLLCEGHTRNDFSGLPLGTKADAAGCAAWTPDMGWGSCATYDHYTYAGAAWARGKDGKRYMQLFVRGGSGMSSGVSRPIPGSFRSWRN